MSGGSLFHWFGPETQKLHRLNLSVLARSTTSLPWSVEPSHGRCTSALTVCLSVCSGIVQWLNGPMCVLCVSVCLFVCVQWDCTVIEWSNVRPLCVCLFVCLCAVGLYSDWMVQCSSSVCLFVCLCAVGLYSDRMVQCSSSVVDKVSCLLQVTQTTQHVQRLFTIQLNTQAFTHSDRHTCRHTDIHAHTHRDKHRWCCCLLPTAKFHGFTFLLAKQYGTSPLFP